MAKKKKTGIDLPSEKDIFKLHPGMIAASDMEEDVLRIPTTCLAYNHQIGGGLPYGKILELFGEESSGKSLMAYNFAYCTQQLGGVVLWNDAEQAWQNTWAKKNNLDLSRVIVNPTSVVEEASDWMADVAIYYRSKLTRNEPILYICDSLAAVDCEMNINSRMVDSKADMGNRAKAIYKMFRIRSELMARLGVSQIYVNQLRKNLKAGLFENPDTTPGGQALRYYASIRSAFYGGKNITEKHKGKDKRVGRYTSIRLHKNKTAPPRDTLKATPMYFNDDYHEIGFDRYHAFGDVLIDMGIISKGNGGVYKYKGETIVRGEDNFKELISEDESFRKRMIKKSGVNTISNTKRQLSKIETNLFPIDNIKYKKQTGDDGEEEETE